MVLVDWLNGVDVEGWESASSSGLLINLMVSDAVESELIDKCISEGIDFSKVSHV